MKPSKHQYERSYTNKWEGPYKVERISIKNNLTYYHIEDHAKPTLRHEVT